MQKPHAFMSVLIALGLIAVSLSCAWLVRRELQITDIAEASTNSKREAQSINGVRTRLYDMRERYKRVSALNVGRRLKETDALFRDLQNRADSASSSLGEKLRPEPPKPFKPEAFFVSCSQGISSLRLEGWMLKNGSAAYTFRISYSHSELDDQVVTSVREGDAVGGLRLLSSTSPTLRGGSYDETVRVTSRGKEISRKVKLPDFRVVRLVFERRSSAAERFTLEAAYEESDQSKAKRSDHSFKPEIHWEIPLASIVLHDNPDGEIRSLTVREGSKFVFTGREYLVRTIRPDHIDVCLSASPNSVETWLLSETPRENP